MDLAVAVNARVAIADEALDDLSGLLNLLQLLLGLLQLLSKQLSLTLHLVSHVLLDLPSRAVRLDLGSGAPTLGTDLEVMGARALVVAGYTRG